MTLESGKISSWNDDKGFGFITPDDGRKDVFVHFRAINSSSGRATLVEGQKVSFTISESPKGLQADGVNIL